MTVFLIFFALFLICGAEEPTDTGKAPEKNDYDSQESIEDIFKHFDDKVSETVNIIKKFKREVDELTKDALEKSLKDTRTKIRAIFEDAEEINEKFYKIKRKIVGNLADCKDKFIGESGVIGHLLELGEEIEFSVKGVKECPDDFSGTECLINRMVHGELVMDEVDQMIEREKGTPQERADSLIKYIETCNEKAVESVKEKVQTLIEDIKKCI
ncbi:unnamed protein product [Hermetia illucens]|uniref:Uncharacterized protein n=1 Tax=Hermetia illucens TaxID=343691 RepID=A0A7R8UNA5_HERIL|nr:uncharacterized protein LOC119651756 [Hermetia illucens]CAD7083845.1 unnamed protein product [Hermetia illucens]